VSKSNQIITGIVIIIAIIIGLFFLYRMTMPTNSEINAATKKISAIQSNIITNPISVQILGMETNGNVPVEVKSEDIGKNNPFQ
jgi:short subunit fatty acids transporter